jgi:predicted nucleotide-binding protein (sugar kinase/HSP70/actin superfamily)
MVPGSGIGEARGGRSPGPPPFPAPIRIGIPRALFYYTYYPFWEKFFTGLDTEVVVSDPTNREILRDGLRGSSNELCLPLKLLQGHVLNLAGRCDYVFLPYIISTQKGYYYCPKLIAAPDIVKAGIPGVSLLSIDVDIENFYGSLYSSLKETASKLSANPIRIYAAYRNAMAHQERFGWYVENGFPFEEALAESREERQPERIAKGPFVKGRPTIAVIGHTYIFNDPYISFDLLGRLRKWNVNVLTSDAIGQDRIDKALSRLERKVHWSLGNRVVASAIHYSQQKSVDGIIYITPFGCSSDSLIKEYIDANIDRKKPMLTLTVDEHSGDAGVVTRLEAFFDMAIRTPRAV